QATDDLRQLANAFAQQNADTRAKKAELISQRGDLMAKNVGALRDSERNYQLAVGTLGLNQQKLAADTAYKQESLHQRAVQARFQRLLTERGQDITAAAHQDAQSLSRAQFLARYGISPEGLQQLPHPGQWLKNHAPVYRRAAGASGGLSKTAQNA